LNFVDAEGGKRRAELDAASLFPFEEKILASGRCGAVLPAVILTVGAVRLVRYDTTGFLRFCEYPFRHLDQVLGVLYDVPRVILEAEDRLLSANKFALGGDTLFVNAKNLMPGLLYGAGETEGAGFCAGYAALLALSRTWDHITGLPEAVRGVEERIRLENPDIRNLLRIVETVRREWNLIHPALFRFGREQPVQHGGGFGAGGAAGRVE
jgi:hypothetical protein